MNTCVVLFFSVDSDHRKFVSQLETSLKETLQLFYPLAGRYLQEIHVVDCSDQGAEFKLAKTNIKLEEILDSEVNLKVIDKFMPSEIRALDQVTDPILTIQLTTFECGGVALGVNASHRLVDASTLCTFLNHWASINRQENDVHFVNGPGFISPSFFPPRGLPFLPFEIPFSKSDEMVRNIVTKKLSFTRREISELKEKIITVNSTQNWSKVQIVFTLICKLLIEIDRRKLGYLRDSVFFLSINLRGRTQTLIPKDACGNLFGLISIDCNNSVKTTQELAYTIRDTIKSAIHCYSKLSFDEEAQMMVLNSLSYSANVDLQSTNVIFLTSWCNFPFYESNFGFGKPVWVSKGSIISKNVIDMIDDAGGDGVEAFVGLESTEVQYFEDALKAFTA